MTLSFEISAVFPAKPEKLYIAWLDSASHAAMTGSPAQVSAAVGGEFVAWDGYISGTNLRLEPDKTIVQSWRTTEFRPDELDSQVEIRLEATETGSKVTITHSKLPAHGMQYKQGWVDHYFTPMRAYFGGGA